MHALNLCQVALRSDTGQILLARDTLKADPAAGTHLVEGRSQWASLR